MEEEEEEQEQKAMVTPQNVNNNNTITDRDDDEDDTDCSEEFVDATGVSQEDIEREKHEEATRKILRKLSNRLSGEHFSGSVGSLLASIQQQQRQQRPTIITTGETMENEEREDNDDGLTESMLNWKRHSDSSSNKKRLLINKRMSTSNSSLGSNHSHGSSHSNSSKRVSSSSSLNNKRYSSLMEKRFSSKSSIITAIDLSTMPATPLPLPPQQPQRYITRKKSEASLSVRSNSHSSISTVSQLQQQKEIKALREETEQLLIARKPVVQNSTPTISSLPKLSSPPQQQQNEQQKENNKSVVKDISAEFSKTLDEVWNATSDHDLLNFDHTFTKQFESTLKETEVHNDEEYETESQEHWEKEDVNVNDGDNEVEERVRQTAMSLWHTSNNTDTYTKDYDSMREDISNSTVGRSSSSSRQSTATIEIVVSKEKMASWLGQKDPFHQAVLYEYMQFFDFKAMRLDGAFRKLCSKLYFKAEAQQIDRILEAFAQRYWDCNSSTQQASVFRSADVVYAIVYSLLLLNTDLHVAQGNHVRMTRSEFLKNTMSTVREQREQQQEEVDQEFRTIAERNNRHTMMETRQWEAELEASLKEMYVSVKQHQILQPLNGSRNGGGTTSNKRTSILYGNRSKVLGLKRSVNSMIRKSARESMLMFEQLEQQQQYMPSSISNPQLVRSSISTPSSSLSITRKDSFSSVNSGTTSSFSSRCGGTDTNGSVPQQQFNQLRFKDISSSSPHLSMNDSILSSPTSSKSLTYTEPPFCKQGIVIRKHLLENATQKARHREWKECYLEVSDGELRMYALRNNNQQQQQQQQHQLLQQQSDKSVLRHSSVTIPSLFQYYYQHQQFPHEVPMRHSNGNHTNSHASAKKLASSGSSTNSSIKSSHSGNYHKNSITTTAATGTNSPPQQKSIPQQLICKISLNHTLSNPLPPPGYNRHRPHVFATQQPDGGVYLFQVPTEQDAHAWVSACNYWASRKSKTPLRIVGGGSNMEYGWNDCLHDVIMDLDNVGDQKYNYFSFLERDPDTISINDWHPPPSLSQLPSELDEKSQLASLQEYLDELNRDINEHRDIKPKMLIKFPTKCQNYNKVMRNWEAKSKYLLHEIIKYQNYCDALEKSIQLKEGKQAAAAATATITTLTTETTTESEDEGDIACSVNSHTDQHKNGHENKPQAVADTNLLSSTTDASTILTKDTLNFQTTSVDLFKEINEELSINLV
ncbi:hypothetical protein BDF20DRAFT_365079 [Mycotypha africana]|uniref:uncharacterized protein n=1 Tax=Mycotypha africana TaxID=64632 RepID=UPI0023001428|nr:uncharacterized protein BDF20DRAFT_365079 [Mycotypha africana]KAI8984095.1 hypothetical protein BDF20DRAFT_365079 [Mycotypha africana]